MDNHDNPTQNNIRTAKDPSEKTQSLLLGVIEKNQIATSDR